MKDEMVCLEPFDWRYSAAIVGLRKYLEWLGVDEEPNLIITEGDKVRFQMVKLVEYGKSFKELVDMYTNYQVPRYA